MGPRCQVKSDWILPNNRTWPLFSASPILPRVKYSENENVDVGHFVANFVITDKNLAYVARIELQQTNTKSRVDRNAFRAGNQLTHYANCNP